MITVTILPRLNLGVELGAVPLESRVLFILYGVEIVSEHQHNRVPIAWAAIRLFDSNRYGCNIMIC